LIAEPLLNDEIMQPVRSVLIELDSPSARDLKWVKNHCFKEALGSLQENRVPDGLLLHITEIESEFCVVADESASSGTRLVMSGPESGLLKILHVGDLIVLWRSIRVEEGLGFGDFTAVLRLPVLNDAVRDPRDCEFHGIVQTIAHSASGYEWTGCQIDVIGRGRIRKTIVFPKGTAFSQKKGLGEVRNGHFVWLFHLCADVGDPNLLQFGQASIIFDVSIMPSLLDSMIVRSIPFSSLDYFVNAVVRGVVIALSVEIVQTHLDCGCVVNRTVCPRCSVPFDGRHRRDLRLVIIVEDGSTEAMKLYGLATSVDFFGYDASDWESQLPRVREKLIETKRGCEFVFFVSRCPSIDFGLTEQTGDVWRADAMAKGREETSRTVRGLVGLLQDDSPFHIGFTGDSLFHNPHRGGGGFLG
jgi:hypothetical protein